MLKKIYKSIFKTKPDDSIEEKEDFAKEIKLKCFFKSVCKSKAGNSIEENEDCVYEPTENEIAFEPILKFAISDGAAESSFAKEWSKLLVSSYKNKLFDKANFQNTIKDISEVWQSIAHLTELPWYAQEKVEGGAFATFIGLTVDLQKCKWQSIAVGDSTLFHIRGNILLDSFPIKASSEYGNTPKLISSKKDKIQDFDFLVSTSAGEIVSGDLILVGTDAISAWILNQIEIEEKPWNQFENLYANDFKEFENWLNEKRNIGEIKNDDSTLLMLKFE